MSESGVLVVVRHGETEWSRLGRHTGLTDLPLTPLGEEQARLTGRALAGRSFDLVLTSPLRRALDTAALAGHPDAAVETDLVEWDYGPVEGLTRAEVSRELGHPWTAVEGGVRVPVRSGTQPGLPQWGPGVSDEGELVGDVAARAARVIGRVTPVLRSGGDVLLFAHGHLLRIFACVWLGIAPEVAERLAFGTASRSVLGFERDREALLQWNIAPETLDPAATPDTGRVAVTDRRSPADRRLPVDEARLTAALLDVVGLMDTLRSPGGCPWDAEQTHASLAPYAVEEAHEVAEAAESGDLGALREELGDLLLQVLFHARVAAERPESEGGFALTEVAEGLAAKLRRRHPHVFPDASGVVTEIDDADGVNRQWDRIKATEKAARGVAGPASALDGIPESLPALMRAQKVLRRARRADIAVGPDPDALPGDDEADLGADLLALVARADALGIDAEAALRRQVRSLVAQVRASESDAFTD